jgi:hypothetical protein
MNESDEGTYEEYCHECYTYTLHIDHTCTNSDEHEDPATREPSWLDLPLPEAPAKGESKYIAMLERKYQYLTQGETK